jgi:hypothetical protein
VANRYLLLIQSLNFNHWFMISGFHQTSLSGNLTPKTREISAKLLRSVMKYSIYMHQFVSKKSI